MDDAPDPSTPDEIARASGDDDLPPVHNCPFCGENIGSFWGRRGDDGSHWCEACQRFFRVVGA